MKKFLYLAAAITVMASCTSDNLVDAPNTAQKGESGAIVFGSTYKGMTRADHTGAEAAALLDNNFVVMGMKSDGTIGATDAPVFNHYNVNWVTNTANTTTSNTNDWEYVAQTKHAHATTITEQSIKYWDYAKSQYDFIAYSAGEATAVFASGDYVAGTNVLFTPITPSTKATSAYTVKGRAADLAKVYIADLVTAYRDKDAANDAAGDYNKVVNIKFRSLSAKVRVALYETVPGYSIQASSVKFYSADDATPTTTATLYTKGSDVFNEEGTYTVYYPTTGSANKSETDYNKAHISFVADGTSGTAKVKGFGTLDITNTAADKEVNEAVGKLYLGRASSDATYAGVNTTANPNYYTIVIPNETGAVLNLKVAYKLVSTDGSGEEISVTGATAQVPAVYATWKSGYAYTYIFKISQNTNGETNPAAGPAGLYPITFDATVVETEDGIQETITTVADPSITTYAKGKVVVDNDEYKTGNNIYVMVNGVTLTTTNAKLFTVDLASGAAQTINEASVANAIANGTYDSSAKTYTVTDANSKAMVVRESDLLSIVNEIAAADAPDGNAITGITAGKFTPTVAGTYAFQYQITAPVAGTPAVYTAVVDGTTLTAGTKYYTDNTGAGEFEALGTEVADGTNYFELTTAAVPGTPGVYAYKIIKVQ